MNKQFKIVDGKRVSTGIGWTDYTHNIVGGCEHECVWEMPDGKLAECYAKTTAHKMRSATFYPNGFNFHYWHPDRLEEPKRLKTPSKIFIDSMSDLMGHWVPEDQVLAVLDMCRQTPQHQYQLLTKNAPRLLKFEFPKNVWVGVSAPPTYMMGHKLELHQQTAMVNRQLEVLKKVNAGVKWMSIEPLSFDIAHTLEMNGGITDALDWVVIGAASNGHTIYQPQEGNLTRLLTMMDDYKIPVFFKENLQRNREIKVWREEFPETE